MIRKATKKSVFRTKLWGVGGQKFSIFSENNMFFCAIFDHCKHIPIESNPSNPLKASFKPIYSRAFKL